MKKRSLVKKFMALVMSAIIGMGCMSSVYAVGNDMVNRTEMADVVSGGESAIIDSKIMEINIIKHELSMLNNNDELSDSEKLAQINELENKIEVLNRELDKLGVEVPSDEFLIELMGESDVNVKSRSAWHPSEAIAKFEEAYEVRGYTAFGENMEMQYHILFSTKQDPYLYERVALTLGQEITSKEQVISFADKVMKVYVGRAIGNVIDEKTRILKYLPWELLLEEHSDLEDTIVCNNANAITCIAHIDTMVKFVYVYDVENDVWKFALSTNRIDYSYTLNTRKKEKGKSIQVNVAQDGFTTGNMDSSIEDASTAFRNNTTMNTCEDSLTITYDGEMKLNGENIGKIYETDIYAPSVIAGMFFGE